jgi:peptidoglycan/LPS O-acetylase OafA/YrhL
MKLAIFLTPSRVLRIACMLALVALALIVWSVLDPRPIPVILAMSVAQGLGTLSFAAFLFVVVRDLRTGQRKERESPAPH